MTPEVLQSVFQYALPALFVLAGTAFTSRRIKRGEQQSTAALAQVKQETAVIRDHVANTHTTNLRDDLDEIRDLVGLARAEQRADHKSTKIELGFIREDIVELKESDTSLWGALKQKVNGTTA